MSEEEYRRRRAYHTRRKKRRRKIILRRIMCLAAVALCVTVGIIASNNHDKDRDTRLASESGSKVIEKLKDTELPEWVDIQIIHKHTTARTGKSLDGVKNIVIHYVGNPNTTAQNNRDYFDKNDTEVSSHFVVGLEGEIIQCIPLWERSAASNWRNSDILSIEVCHPDESGKFSEKTYNSLVMLTSWLLKETGLDESAVIRHYDITGKLCPLYYVEHEEAWNELKADIAELTV